MGWGYRKSWTFGPPGLKRWVHLKQNATHKGLSSWSAKLFFIGWNSKRGWHFDGPGGVYWRQGKRGKKTSPSRGKRDEERRRGPVGATAHWAGGWARRGSGWAGDQAVSRARGHYLAVTAPGRLRAEQIRRHGYRTAAVTDMFTGEIHAAPAVALPDPAGGDAVARAAGDHAWRQQWFRDNDDRVTHATRPVTLSWWERRQLAARGEDPDRWEARWNAASAALLLHRAGRLARDGGRFPIVSDTRTADPAVPDLAARPGGVNQKEAAVANSIRTFADLNDPGIDPMNFAEELPDQLGEAHRLVSERAEELSQEADRHRADAQALAAYADYMESAEVERGIASELRDAAEAADGIAKAFSDAAEGMGQAADSVGSARRAAESEYGDFKMPRFDKAG